MGNKDKIKVSDTTKLGSIQKCPYHKSVLVWAFRLGQMVFGTVGLIYLNIWAAILYLLYSFVFTFWAWPVKHCKYCYYNITTRKLTNGKTIMNLLPIDECKNHI